MLDDFLIVVMRESVTTSELTMLEFGEHDMVPPVPPDVPEPDG